MNILVLGGTGNVGQHLVRNLLARGQSVRVLVRNAERAALLPQGAEAFVADVVGDPDGTRTAFTGIDGVFMLNAATLHECVEGLMVVGMAKAAGVKRFVYQSTHSIDHLHDIPHLGAKMAIEAAVKKSGMIYTIISPNHFFQNDDTLQIPLMQHGVYISPLGDIGCWRVDVRDIADAAAIALTTEGHGGKTYALIGPENLTGPQCAEVWAKALGKPIHYEGDVRAWQGVMQPYLPAWLLDDLGAMLDRIIERGMQGNAAQLAELTVLLGRPPRSYADYVAECAAAWQAANGS